MKRVIKEKIYLWLSLSASHPDDLSENEMRIMYYLDLDNDVIEYLEDCEKKQENLNIEEWSDHKKKDEFKRDSE